MPLVVKLVIEKFPRKNWPSTEWNEFVRSVNQYFIAELGPQVKGDFLKTTAGWQHQPDFQQKIMNTVRTLSLEVRAGGANKRIYEGVNFGTAGRTIVARPNNPKGVMIFPADYTPHTQPGGSWGGPGLRHGDTVVATSVNWPGIRARKFDEIIKDKHENKFQYKINALLQKAFKT